MKNVYLRLFRNRNFAALWAGQLLSFVGNYFNWLVVPIVINRLTGSATMVGLAMIANFIPALLLGPFAGVFVDRWNRKYVMIISDGLRALLVLLMLFVRDASQVWIFFVVGFFISCTGQFFFPASAAVLPLIVEDPEDLMAANSLMQVIQTVGFLAGPALAGFAIGLWGESIAFIANSIGYAASGVSVLLMSIPHTTAGKAAIENIRHVFSEMWEGIVYLFGNQTMVGVLICLSVLQLGLGALNVIWVPYLQRTFGVGASGLGMVDSSFGLGMVISGALMGYLTSRLRNRGRMASAGILACGLPILLIGFSPTFTWILVINLVLGLFWLPANSALTTIMQLAIPDLKRGRVNSSLGAVTTAAGLISMASATVVGESIGLRSVYIIIGVIIIFSGLSGFWLLKESGHRTG